MTLEGLKERITITDADAREVAFVLAAELAKFSMSLQAMSAEASVQWIALHEEAVRNLREIVEIRAEYVAEYDREVMAS